MNKWIPDEFDHLLKYLTMEQVNVYSIKHYKISGMFLKSRFNLVSFIATLENRKWAQPNPSQNHQDMWNSYSKNNEIFLIRDIEWRIVLSWQSLLDHPSHWTLPTLETEWDAEKGTEDLQFWKSPLKVSHFRPPNRRVYGKLLVFWKFST